MAEVGNAVNRFLTGANSILWHDSVLFFLLGTGLLFTIWSGFSQWRALTHGVRVVRGSYDNKGEPGAISHFQALAAALSATVGLGNIGGVALAIALGGPGAVFWMWVVGVIGMALKTTEVTLSMLYRKTDEKDNPHGGPMWVVSQGLAEMKPSLGGLGKAIGIVFCVTLLISAVTGGNMFQAWNVGLLTETYYGVPAAASGMILAILVGLVIIGGIKRIGAVAGRLVPVMCLLYLMAAAYVLIMRYDALPGVVLLIFTSAFSATEAQGAFLGGTIGYAFMWGMKRAFFSNEAGQGSAPIAHSAARTSEPVREGVVAGLEPFIDTIVVCSLTAFVILASGAWNRGAEAQLSQLPRPLEVQSGEWSFAPAPLPAKSAEQARVSGAWREGESVFLVVDVATDGEAQFRRLGGRVAMGESGLEVRWGTVSSERAPVPRSPGVYVDYAGATLTSHAFDRILPGLGRFLVPLAAWLFAISTMISWGYYGEQGVVFMLGKRFVFPYKIIYCLLIVVACSGWIKTDAQLDDLSGFGTGVMLFANIPIMLLFGHKAMRAYKDYIRRLDAGEMKPPHAPRSIIDLVHNSNNKE
jgi:alanine or glycine:cation symporter, AGCS family